MSESTFSGQSTLPHQPVPSPRETFSLLLETLKPLANNEEELKQCQSLVAEILSSRELKARQEWLEMLAKEEDSWLNGSKSLWLTLAYWSWTDYPLPGVSNVVGFIFLESLGAKMLDQVFSAAATSAAFIHFNQEILAGRVPIAKDRLGHNLCMDQWRYIYGTTRIPGESLDKLVVNPRSQYIVAMRNGHVFRIDYGDMAHLCWAFQKVIEESDRLKHQSIGALTGARRKSWSASRMHLASLSPSNAETLNTIESAAFIVVLDNNVVGPSISENNRGTVKLESDDDQVRRLHHYCKGKWGGEDRWYDKSFTIVVNPMGQVGLNVEHSWAEASVPLSVMSGPVAQFVRYCYTHDQLFNLSAARKDNWGGRQKAMYLAKQRRGHGGCYHLPKWDLDKNLLRDVADAEAKLALAEADSDISLLRCHSYNTKTMKALKVSPDSCLQMAIQLAFFRIHGRLPHGTYETTVLTKFLKGRTATCRVVSVESQEFCQDFVAASQGGSKEKAVGAFKKACKSHAAYVKRASDGRGVDRHLLAVSSPLPPNFKAPPPVQSDLWKHPLFKRAQSWELSTSNNSYLNNSGGHFCTVNSNGYGIGYLAKSEYTFFAVECKHSAELGRGSGTLSAAKVMSQACVKALADIHDLMDVSPTSSTAKM